MIAARVIDIETGNTIAVVKFSGSMTIQQISDFKAKHTDEDMCVKISWSAMSVLILLANPRDFHAHIFIGMLGPEIAYLLYRHTP